MKTNIYYVAKYAGLSGSNLILLSGLRRKRKHVVEELLNDYGHLTWKHLKKQFSYIQIVKVMVQEVSND